MLVLNAMAIDYSYCRFVSILDDSNQGLFQRGARGGFCPP